ncbi:hypothetical protein FA95DRAFT_1683896 [Auriscalpium vulgare]|uniref:Uncharacterized protein n=1 Tax=Auriscalpium vulgare TaxID=40419 RepID=A0ACB8R7Z4_9AGAM|nr:hypothetical protein FA95DRAFT_1683896 [Auriscalpium vulgare]
MNGVPPARFYNNSKNPRTPSRKNESPGPNWRVNETEPPFEATPFRSSSSTGETNFAHDGDNPTVSAVDVRLNAELAGHWVNMGGVTALRTFLLKCLEPMECKRPQAQGWGAEVKSYVSKVDVLHAVPIKPRKEEPLYDPYVKQSNKIAKYFKLDASVSAENTSRVNIIHQPFLNTKLSTKPDLSFTKRKKKSDDLSYAQIRTVWDAKKDINQISGLGLQLGMYARQILAEQPGRRFVITFVLSGKHLRLFMFDRCGVMYSDKVDIREHQDIFVLAVLTSVATSPIIDMDPTIKEPTMSTTPYWTISLPNPSVVGDFEYVAPFLVEGQPAAAGHTVRGRSTICWKTKDGLYIIKDYWRAQDRLFEAEFLKELAGIKGVGQLRAYQDNLCRVSAVRGAGHLLNDAAQLGTATEIPDRIQCRQVLDRYTGDLSCAPNPLAMLIAFRDAVVGHRNALLVKGILHRDVSLFNIMFDKRARDGALGRLIDFDHAKKFEDLFDKNATGGDLCVGTRMYQSVKVLRGDPKVFGVHDHMDDLESFFYVLIHLFTGFTGTGPIDAFGLPPVLQRWNNADTAFCATMKLSFMTGPLAFPMSVELVDAFLPLLEGLQQFFRPRIAAVSRAKAIRPEPMPTKNCRPADHLLQAAKDYKSFLEIVDAHIAMVKNSPELWARRWVVETQKMLDAAADGSAEPARPASPTPSNASTVVGISRKRSQAFLEEGAGEDDVHVQHAHKRRARGVDQ